MPITFFVRKIGPVHVAELGLTAGRQAGGRQVADEIQVNLEIFKVQKLMKPYDFLPIPTIKYYRT